MIEPSFSSFFDILDYSISSIFIQGTHTRIFNNTVDSYAI